MNHQSSLEFLVVAQHHVFIDIRLVSHPQELIMTALTLAPGANVIGTATHEGIERFTTGLERANSLLSRAIAWVDAFNEERAAAHNAATAAALAATDHRVLAELRAAYTRSEIAG
jgi:hypothetical protein